MMRLNFQKLSYDSSARPQTVILQPQWHGWWPAGLRNHLDQKLEVFLCKYWCSSLRPPFFVQARQEQVSPSTCFSLMKMRGRPARNIHEYLVTLHKDPFSASNVWGISLEWSLSLNFWYPWHLELGTKTLVPGSWYQDLGITILVPRPWYQGLGIKILVSRSLYRSRHLDGWSAGGYSCRQLRDALDHEIGEIPI